MTAAVITGASAGLGAEFTRQLVREFPEIEEFWLIARRVGKLEELAQQFPEKKFVCMGLNLLDPKSFRYLGEKLAEQEGEHIFKFRVKLNGETKVQAVAGDSIDDAVFRKVDAPNPDYKLTKKKSTSANWV